MLFFIIHFLKKKRIKAMCMNTIINVNCLFFFFIFIELLQAAHRITSRTSPILVITPTTPVFDKYLKELELFNSKIYNNIWLKNKKNWRCLSCLGEWPHKMKLRDHYVCSGKDLKKNSECIYLFIYLCMYVLFCFHYKYFRYMS